MANLDESRLPHIHSLSLINFNTALPSTSSSPNLSHPINLSRRGTQHTDWAAGWNMEDSVIRSPPGGKIFFFSPRPVVGHYKHHARWKTGIFKRFIAQTVCTVCTVYTRINYRIVPVNNLNKYLHYGTSNGKAISLQAWTGPEGSRRLRFPDFKTIGTRRW